MTDERIAIGDLLRAAKRLPRGAGIIVRHHATPLAERQQLFEILRGLSRRRGIVLFLAGDMARARAWGADGAHGQDATPPRRSTPGTLPRSAPVHDMAELRRAERNGAAVLFLSPVFPTRSHPGARPLGSVRFSAIARSTSLPVMALGGVKPRHAALLRRLGASGFSAIDSLTSEKARPAGICTSPQNR